LYDKIKKTGKYIGDTVKKIKFIAKASDGIIRIPKKYQMLISGNIEITVEKNEITEDFDKIVNSNINKYAKALKKLSQN